MKILNITLKYGLVLFVFLGCTKMDDNYKKYVVNDGIIYTQKPTNVIAYTGYNRIELVWPLPTDPNVKRAVIYYNNGADSTIVNMSNQGDSVRQIISNLTEGPQTFVIKSFDDKGNSSLPVEVSTRVYGDKYIQDLQNRYIVLAWYDYGQLTIDWAAASLGTYRTEVIYTTVNGTSKTYTILPDEKRTIISDYKAGTALQYRTVYAPAAYNLDYFNTATVNETVAVRMNRALWKVLSFTTEETGWFDGRALNTLDGNINTFWHSRVSRCWDCDGYPHWIKYDLTQAAGQTRTVEGVIINARAETPKEGFRDFKIMGNDGNGWFDIKAYQIDENKGVADQVFMFPEKVKVRYLQIYMTSSLVGQFYAHMSEFNAYGY